MKYRNTECLLIGLFVLILLTNCAGANAWNINKGTVYPSIQAAIDAASAGDTIKVDSGTYDENVNVNKQLTLAGVDNGAGLPVVDGSGSDSAITISANGSYLSGFVAVNGEFGIRVISSGNTISGNNATGNTRDGIYIETVSGNTISSNTANSNGRSGIFLLASSSNTVSDNNATGNSQYGIYLWNACSNIISTNTANSNTQYGIYLNSSSSDNTISDNTVSDNAEFGVLLVSSSGNTISDNSVTDNSNGGIYIDSSSNNNNISGNAATGNSDCGISVIYCSGNNLIGNTANDNSQHGFYIGRSTSNNLTGNTANGNSGSGICIAYSSNNNALSGNVAARNSNYGICLLSSSNNNTLDGNAATSNSWNGISLSASSDNTISGNTATGNTQHGISLYASSDNTISGNTATGNSWNGIDLYASSDNTISGNTATGNTEHGILLTVSSNNTISGNTASSNSCIGIELLSSSDNNTISGNTATDNTGYGMDLGSSSNNTISGNTATGNTQHGIYLHSSSDNTISGNNATGNTQHGIYIESSSDNTISGNNATANGHGIYLQHSSDNTIYLNTLDNTYNARSDSDNNWNATSSQTYVHNGRTLNGFLGNIWSDYVGYDCDRDGVGDTSYSITGGSEKDLHPIGGQQPGLEVEKIADRNTAKIGDLINYTIWINNTGKGDLTGVQAEDNLTSTIWTIGTLAVGQNYTNTTNHKVSVSDLPGPIVNKLWANATNPCGYEINNSSIATVAISYLPQIMVNKTANLTEGTKSTILNFDINVSNTGNVDFSGASLKDLLPDGLDYISDDSGLVHGQTGNEYTWNLGSLNASDSLSFNLTARINGNKYGDLVNTVNATGYTGYGEPVNASATASVLASEANLSVTKSADPTSGSKGSQINFTLTVKNNGNPALSQVFVSDLLPAGLKYDSSDGGANNGQFINWTNVGPLAKGASRTLWLKATIDGSAYGTLTNQVNVTGTPNNCEPVNASAIASVLAGEANISITNAADPSSGSKGTSINFTLTVTNNGSAMLSQVFVSDLLPAGLKYDSSDGGANNGQFINWSNIGPLAKDASRTLWLKASIDGSAYGTLTNQVNATGTTDYGKSANASATASVLADEANLSVTKSADPTSGSKGSQINFTLTVKNNGNAALSQVLVSDLLPAGLKYDSSDGGANNGQFINWSNIGPLAKGVSRILWLKATIDGSAYGTLTNQVNVTGTPNNGEPVNASATASVLADEANLSVTKSADPTSGSKGSQINFTLTVKNNGNAALSQIFVSDLLPAGLKYDSSDGGANSGQFINWTNVGPLAKGASRILWLKATIDGSAYGTLTNQVNVIGMPNNGEPVNASTTASVTSSNICLSGHKFLASTGKGLAGWNIAATDSTGNATSATTDSSGLWQICNISVGTYTVSEVLKDGWMQISPKEGSYNVVLDNDSISDLDFYNDRSCNLTIKKTVDKPAARRGEDITYTVDLSNPCAWGSFTNVTLWDILPKSVVLVSVSPDPSTSSAYNLTWDVGTLGPGQNFEATIVVRVPIVDINYDSSQTVRGEGFVNVHDDYDTHQGPESITNCAYAKADLVETISSCASTKIIDPGTELQSRESGSGSYESEEAVRMRTENKSIRSISSVSAVHRPTSFSLPQNRSIDYGTKWTEATRGINSLTGATIDEQYTFANRINKNRSIELDENGSTMKTEFEVEGVGHIGTLKKESPDSHPKTKPIYESSEDFVGSFRATEFVDEYGSSVQSNKSMTGYGYVSADKRVRDSQRTYESGTGSYRSDEIISTPTNYIAKDISLVHGPTNYSYTPQFNLSQDIKWSEGMWSKSGTLRGGDITSGSKSCVLPAAETVDCNSSESPATYIGESYSSLDYLKKDSVALGLDEMKTNASFSGIAEFRAKAAGSSSTEKIDDEERYAGEYSITRDVRIGGASKYDRPHITVTKDGRMTSRWFNKTNANVAEYAITITNDGSSSLAPIYVRDIFPPETEYISSSIRPASLSGGSVNWTLLNLGIGNSVTIDLALNITDYAPANLVNRVMVCGMKGDDCISASAYSTLESGAMGCCQPELLVAKTAKLDASDLTQVHYTIVLKNNANSSMACTVTDRLPTGMSFLKSSVEVSSYVEPIIKWVLVDLLPGEVRTIEYDARASTDGRYVNSVQVDATAVDGSGYATVEAAAQIDIGSTGVAPKTTRYGGWQAPDWNMTSPDEGITIELSEQE